MNTNYQFSDIIGSTYKNGPVRFTSNGNTLLCSNGNRLKSIDIKRNLSRTFNVQSSSNITNFAVNNTGTHAFLVGRDNRCVFVNLYNDIVLHRFRELHRIKALSFSPDSRLIAIGTGGSIKIYSIAAEIGGQFRPLILVNKVEHSVENVNSLDWSFDGRLVIAGGDNRIVKVFSAQRNAFANVGTFVFGQPAPLVDVWFGNDNGYGLICIDKSGKASTWESSLGPDQLVPKRRGEKCGQIQGDKLVFIKRRSVNLGQHLDHSSQVSASTINKPEKLLAVSFTNGVFCVFELTDFSLLQNFRAGEQRINSIHINSTGDWLAFGSGGGDETQLLVWEWRSESYILRQQSHSQTIATAAYSPDGCLIATGAGDGKVKLWNWISGMCLVTFTEHRTGVTDVCFTQSGKAVLSASLDGSIRAHDLKRYRNFRTLAAPTPTQLNLLCADSTGDMVMASSGDLFEIYLWALETGQLLEVLKGHANMVSGLATFANTLCSTSLDKTLRFWNILEGNCVETVQLLDEGLDLKYSPSDSLLAVLCYDSCINLFDTKSSRQLGLIETRLDLESGQLSGQKVKKSSLEKNKAFTCIAFSPDGQFLLAGGQSNIFCVYSVADRIRVRSFKLSQNLSLDGTALDIDFRKMTEFGNLDLFDLSDSEEEGLNPDKKLKLAGTKHTNLSERAVRPTILISKLAYSPTGQDFAVVCSEGVYVFTLNRIRRFDPFQLELDTTPDEIRRLIRTGDCKKALTFALKLNDSSLIRRVVESVPKEQLAVVLGGIGFEYAERLLEWLGTFLSGPIPNRHFHFDLLLIKELLYAYGADFKRSLEQNRPALIAVQQLLASQQNLLMNVCAQNTHSLEYILTARDLARLDCEGASPR